MVPESKTAVYGAVTGNAAITLTKFYAAAVTGSSAMVSEGIHSLVDTGNGLLLLLGMHRARKPADAQHPFGHGKELYFWSLIAAILIFGVGGGISAYEGILHIQHPSPLRDPKWNYIVLASAALFEGTSLTIALRAFLRQKGRQPFLRAFRNSKDPAVYMVVAEDSAALLGLAAAFVGVYASHRWEMPAFDGAASIAIGLLLGIVAWFLIVEVRGLLIGEGVDRQTAEAIRRAVLADPRIEDVARPLTMYFGPEDALLALDVQFKPGLAAADVEDTVSNIETRLRKSFPHVRRIYIEAASLKPPAAAACRPVRAPREPAHGKGSPPSRHFRPSVRP